LDKWGYIETPSTGRKYFTILAYISEFFACVGIVYLFLNPETPLLTTYVIMMTIITGIAHIMGTQYYLQMKLIEEMKKNGR
jgi:hypothetical protein